MRRPHGKLTLNTGRAWDRTKRNVRRYVPPTTIQNQPSRGCKRSEMVWIKWDENQILCMYVRRNTLAANCTALIRLLKTVNEPLDRPT
jgi:hypothetical protein